MAVEGNGLVWRDWEGCEGPLIDLEGLGWLWRAIDWWGRTGMAVEGK